MDDDRPGRGSDQFPLRFPNGMREQLKIVAKANGRSLNTEILDRIEKSFSDQNDDAIRRLLQSLTNSQEQNRQLGDAMLRLNEQINELLKEIELLRSSTSGT